MNDFDELPDFEDEITSETEWKTQAGVRVAIKDMADSHLLRTIRVLRDISPIGTTVKVSPERRRMWINAMANEAYKRNLAIDPLTDEESAESHE